MTGPVGDAVGVAYADLRFRGDKAPKDVAQILDDAGDKGNVEMEDIGDKWGDTLDKRLKSSTKDTGRDVARGISSGIEREGLKVTREVFQLDSNGDVIKSWITREVVKGERAVEELATSGAFKKIGGAVNDAIGASFNISGKSPLIPLLATLFGFIGELVVGAIQIVNGLTAVVAVIPNAIGAVILQVGVLFLAFQGVGGAIQQAFAAKNPEELKKALEGLTPAAQDFVQHLLPLRDLFKQMRDVAQEGFFDKMGESLTRVTDALGPLLLGGIGAIASGLGDVARGILNVLDSPVFTQFLNVLIPGTVQWLFGLNSALQDFLTGLASFGTAVMPFFNWLGDQLNGALADFGTWLGNLSVDPEFLAWLEHVKVTLSEAGDALKSILGFLKEFANALDKAGANEALNDIRTQFDELTKFLKTDEGIKAMEGLLHIIQALAFMFIFLVNSFVLFAFLLEVTAEFIKNGLLPAIGDFLASAGEGFFNWVTTAYGLVAKFFTQDIPNFFTWLGGYIKGFFDDVINFVGEWVIKFVGAIGDGIGWIITKILEGTAAVAVWIHDRVMDVVDFAKSIPGRITDAIGDLGNLLYDAGANIIRGLINGIKSQFGNLWNTMGEAFKIIRDHGPFSPAKEGPLSGSGDPMIMGENIIKRLAAGIDMEAPLLTEATSNATANVLVGAGAVQMNFYGAPPTNAQASGIGAAAGNSLADSLGQRNTRLAVRSIGIAAAAN